MNKKKPNKIDPEQDQQRIDVRVLGQILAAQNVIFALPDAARIAEFYAQTLRSIPGITACRICLGDRSIQAGDMENVPCAACEASRPFNKQNAVVVPAESDFKCTLTDRSDMRIIAIDSYQHHFGFFVFKIDNAAGFDAYHPFINNLSNYVAITFENRLQKEQLQKAHRELERRVEERTHDLITANEELQREIAERQRTEEALRKSEEQVKQLFNESPVAMVLSQGSDEHVEWINQKFIELFGYTLEDVPDVENWWSLAYPEEAYQEEIKKRWLADVEQAIRNKGHIKPMEAKVRCKDGSYRHIEFRLSSIGEKHLVTFVDLTERKRAEDELRQNREATLQFSEQLAALQDVTNELSKVETVDDLCLQAVLLGHSRLGFDRVSIWFIEEHLGIMRGSFGTDEHGGLRDERNAQVEFKHEGLGWLLFSHKESMALVEHRPLYDHLGRVVGEGDNALAALWDGDEVIGVVCVDNLFTGQPIREHRLEVLRLYATTLGHLIRRKRTENALWNSSQMLKLVLENMPAFVFWKDRNSVYLGCNKLFAANAGFDSPEKLIGLTDLDLPWKHTEAESYRADDRMVMESGIPKLNYEETQLTAEGQIMAVRTSKIPLRDQNGDIIGVLGTFEDITDRKKAEQALRESEWRYHEIFDNVLDGLYLIHVTESGRFHVMEVNPAVERITGISYSSFLGKTPEEILPADVAEMVNGKLLHCIEMGRPTEEEAELDLPVGRRNIYSTLIPAKDETGKVRRIIGISRDITERKVVEKALRESENRFRVLSENAFVGIYVIQDGRLSYVNSTLARIFGYSPEELTGAEPNVVIHPDDRAMVSENIRRRIVGEVETVHYEFRGQCKNSEIKNIEVLGGRVDLGGKTAIIGNLMDITERKRHELERESIITVSTTLRQATTKSDILNVILDQLMDLFKADGAVLVLPDPQTKGLIDKMGRGPVGERMLGLTIPPDTGVANWVIKNKQPYLNNHADQDPVFYRSDLLGESHCLAAVPLIAQERAIGALWIACHANISEQDLGLLNAIADIAANAIHRVTLHEQTEQQLHHLMALHQIDIAISANFDLNVTLNVILKNVKDELEVDAASILLLNPVTHTLDYAAGIGFRTHNIENSHVRLGHGYAGRAAQTYRTVFSNDLPQAPGLFSRSSLLAAEEFISHYATPLIVKGQVKGALEVFHRETFETNQEWIDYFETLATQAAIAIENASLFENLQRSNLELTVAYDATIEGWSRALDLRDKETEGHTQRVTEMVLELAEKLDMSDAEKMDLRRGALLHDIGKMGVPDSILLKPGPLSESEWEIMRQHPNYAFQMLSPISYLKHALDIPYCHHEKWDGSGYPRGLKGESIPISARLFSIVDVFDALTSDRPYRTAWTREKVYRYIQGQSGISFDPHIVEIFLLDTE